MPVIVKSPYHHAVLLNEIELVHVERIVPQFRDYVGGAPKGRLMRNHKIVAGRGGSLQHVQSGHESCRYALDRARRRFSLFAPPPRAQSALSKSALASEPVREAARRRPLGRIGAGFVFRSLQNLRLAQDPERLPSWNPLDWLGDKTFEPFGHFSAAWFFRGFIPD